MDCKEKEDLKRKERRGVAYLVAVACHFKGFTYNVQETRGVEQLLRRQTV